MKTALATVSLSGDLRQKLDAIAAAGFDGVEIFEQDLIASDMTPRAIGQMVRDHGLEITLFQPFRDFEGLPEPLRARAFARAQHKFDLMCELGCDLMLICSSVHTQARGGIDRAAEDLRALGEMAGQQGLRVGYEALAWGRYVNDHRDAWEIVRRADHPRIGLILDSFHTLARGIDVNTICAIPGDRIFYVHLADAPRLGVMDYLYWSRHFRCMPGEGDLDVTGFTRAVLSTGYDHVLSPEIFNDQFRGGKAGMVAQDGYRSVIALLDEVRRQEPESPQKLPQLPPALPVLGAEFIEFATSEADQQNLENFLHAAGFDKAGGHVSKPVALWRQGRVNILVNMADSGFARTAYVNHGTSISEVALKVEDARAAHARALALGARPHAEAQNPDELHIPAVWGIGGSILRLVDDGPELGEIWTRDFRSEGAAQGVGVTAIDHIGQTMAYDEMLSWSLFYATLFKARKSAIVDVVDPDGLVRSQSLETEGMRFTLNGAENHRTVAGRFIQDSLGASVQHVAFATDDIFATSKALAARSFARLEIGKNYYDDLQARFGLPQSLLERLAAEHILYDEDASGSFFQLYSRTHASGLFFEFVQRTGQYDGYGSANSPYRIAAQRRAARAPGMPRK
ncbi:MAG: TIM barrel protein [Roseinatronobacter sp.]|nr:TIM barrel protein [Roseinatronobacter sp.]